LDAQIIAVDAEPVQFEGEIFAQWLAPDYRAVGWHNTSVGLGAPGNTVLNGHHNIKGEVFRDLYQLQTGDEIDVFSGDQEFRYTVVYTAVLPERNQPLEVRLANAEWIQPTEDERITLITCWPYESNTHRVVVVAVPLRDTPSS
jgi:sortase A